MCQYADPAGITPGQQLELLVRLAEANAQVAAAALAAGKQELAEEHSLKVKYATNRVTWVLRDTGTTDA